MAEIQNCKAAGDSGNVENIVPLNVMPSEKLKEDGDKSISMENGKMQCLLDTVTQQESCPLIINKNIETEAEKKGEKEECCPLIVNKNENEILEKVYKSEHEEICPLIKNEEKTLEKNGNEEINTTDVTSNLLCATKLQQEIEKTEKKFAKLEETYNALSKGKGDACGPQEELENLKTLMAQTQLKLDDRVRVVANQENQINALMSQVSSLKDVVNITKDLLNIRNMEVKHLQENVEAMEEKINLEREKHNTMLIKMESAFKINLDLKQEYETQLRLFQELREKYDKKVSLLTEENINLLDKQNKTI